MPKPIKLEEHVYDGVDELRGKGETFSQAVERLIQTRETVCELLDVLEGMIKFTEWKRKREDR